MIFSEDNGSIALAVSEKTARVVDARTGFGKVRVTHQDKVNTVAFIKPGAKSGVTASTLVAGTEGGVLTESPSNKAEPNEEEPFFIHPVMPRSSKDGTHAIAVGDDKAREPEDRDAKWQVVKD